MYTAARQCCKDGLGGEWGTETDKDIRLVLCHTVLFASSGGTEVARRPSVSEPSPAPMFELDSLVSFTPSPLRFHQQLWSGLRGSEESGSEERGRYPGALALGVLL